jgi:hypothetical protein
MSPILCGCWGVCEYGGFCLVDVSLYLEFELG